MKKFEQYLEESLDENYSEEMARTFVKNFFNQKSIESQLRIANYSETSLNLLKQVIKKLKQWKDDLTFSVGRKTFNITIQNIWDEPSLPRGVTTRFFDVKKRLDISINKEL